MITLVSFIERVADLLASIDGLHWRALLAGSLMAIGGTGLKVLIPKLPTAHNGYVELYRNDTTAVFQYATDKNGEDLVAKLRPFSGSLTASALNSGVNVRRARRPCCCFFCCFIEHSAHCRAIRGVRQQGGSSGSPSPAPSSTAPRRTVGRA